MPNPENLTPFSKDYQPERQGRPKGVKNRSTIAKQILAMKGVFPKDKFAKMQELFPDIQNNMTLEEIMTIVVAGKAISKGDSTAYSKIMDSAYGLPKQTIDQSITEKPIFKTIDLDVSEDNGSGENI